MKLKRGISVMLASALALSMIGCGSEAEEAAPAEEAEEMAEKNLVLAENWTFDAGIYTVLTEQNSANYGAMNYLRNFYDTLVEVKDGEFVPSLAESWTISPDGRVYTFKIREGVKFSDGTPLTAEAVKLSIDSAPVNLGISNGSYGRLTTLIENTEAPDDNTFVLTLATPYYGTLNDLAMCNPLGIVNPAVLHDDLTYDAEMAQQASFGTGAYMYEGDFDGQTYTFVRNPYYWGEAPDADTFQIKVIPDNDAKVLALRSGEIDAIIGSAAFSADSYIELSEDEAFATSAAEEGSMTRYIGMNYSNPIFSDKQVREAMEMAIDRDALANVVFHGTEKPAYSLFDKSKAYCDVDVKEYAFDVDGANALMEEAGWIDTDGDGVREKDGQTLELDLKYSSAYGSLGDAMLAVCENLGAIGFKVTPTDCPDLMAYMTVMMTGDYDLIEAETYGGLFDPITVMTNLNPDVSMDPVSVQWTQFIENGPALLAELDSTADEDRIQEIYTTVLQEINEDALFIPLTTPVERAAWNPEKVENYNFYPDCTYTVVANFDLK